MARTSGVITFVGLFLLVMGWRLCIVAMDRLGQCKIADRFTAIRQFKQDLVPNHANTRLTFCQDTAEGVGMYYCNVSDGRTRLLCEKKENPLQWRFFSALGWSPDDRLLACAWPDTQVNKEFILIFDGSSGEQISKLEVDQGLQQFAWLSDDSFAYATSTDVRVVVNQGGAWTHKRYFGNVANKLENLSGLSEKSVVWSDAGTIWGLDLDSTSARRKIWAATTNNLVEFRTDTASGKILLNCSDDDGQSLFLLNPETGATADEGRIGPFHDYIRNAVWTGRDVQFAFLTNELGGSGFWIKNDESLEMEKISWPGGVGCGGTGGLTLNGKTLFFVGSEEGESQAIYECNLKDKSFSRVYPSRAKEDKNNNDQSATFGTITNTLGEIRFYHLWSPHRVIPGKKYPVLLAQELNTWFPYLQIAADCGFFVAVVDRPFSHTWNGGQQKTWEEDVQSLRDNLTSMPEVDTNQFYYFAYSAETRTLSHLLNENPALWKGAVLFSPADLPTPDGLKGKNVLAIAGRYDSWADSELENYQKSAAALGHSIEAEILPNSGHIPESADSERIRARLFARFLLDNR